MKIAIVQVTALDATILALGNYADVLSNYHVSRCRVKFAFHENLNDPMKQVSVLLYFILKIKEKKTDDCRYDRFDRWNAQVASVAAEDYQTIGLGYHAAGGGSSWSLSVLSVRSCW